jgi:predicted ABC-type ATPase
MMPLMTRPDWSRHLARVIQSPAVRDNPQYRAMVRSWWERFNDPTEIPTGPERDLYDAAIEAMAVQIELLDQAALVAVAPPPDDVVVGRRVVDDGWLAQHLLDTEPDMAWAVTFAGNPWHDELGRFAPKGAGAASPFDGDAYQGTLTDPAAMGAALAALPPLDDVARVLKKKNVTSPTAPVDGKFAVDETGYASAQTVDPLDPTRVVVTEWDHAAATLGAERGYDALPQKMGSAEFDAYVADSGATVLYRGVGRQEFASEFTDGTLFWGRGIDGSGSYTTPEVDRAVNYAGKSGGTVVRMALHPAAKTIDIDTLYEGITEARKQIGKGKDPETVARRLTVADYGRAAIALGYDAITNNAPDGRAPQTVVLNRGALVIDSGFKAPGRKRKASATIAFSTGAWPEPDWSRHLARLATSPAVGDDIDKREVVRRWAPLGTPAAIPDGPERDLYDAALRSITPPEAIDATSAVFADGKQSGNPWHDEIGRFAPKGTGKNWATSEARLPMPDDRSPSAPGSMHGGRPGMGDIPVAANVVPDANPTATVSTFYDFQAGQWSPERAALHDKIVTDYLSGNGQPPAEWDGQAATPPPPRVFVMLGGGPAAGKTTALNSGVYERPAHAVIVNADEVKAMLPEGAAGEPGWAPRTHEESSYLAKRIEAAAIERGANVILDGTGTKPARAAEVAADVGMELVGRYTTVDVATALARADARAAATGRVVLPDVIVDKHRESTRRLVDTLDTFDDLMLHDNSAEGPPRLVASKRKGEPLKVHDQGLWDTFIAKGEYDERPDIATASVAPAGTFRSRRAQMNTAASFQDRRRDTPAVWVSMMVWAALHGQVDKSTLDLTPDEEALWDRMLPAAEAARAAGQEMMVPYDD